MREHLFELLASPPLQEAVDPFRQNFWNIPTELKIALYTTIAVAALALFFGMWRRMNLYFEGQPEARLDHLPQRLMRLLANVLGQLRIARQSYPGMMHLMMFWGFLVLFLGTSLATVDADFLEPFGLKMLDSKFYLFYEFSLDSAGFFFLIGLGMGWYRRYIRGSVKLSYDWGWAFTLGILFLINFTGFVVEGFRLAVWQPDWQYFSPFGYLTGLGINLFDFSEGAMRLTHQVLWVVHFALVAIFMAAIPYTPLMHLITSPLNILLARIEDDPRRERTLQPIPDIEEQEVWGVGELSHFSWAQLLQFDACTECGRCQVACPAWNAGTALNPKHVIIDLRNHMLSKAGFPYTQLGSFSEDGAAPVPATNGTQQVAGGIIRDETLWACTTCYACVYECPVLIEHVDAIVDMRRYLTMTEGRMPDSVSGTMRNLERSGNPWGYRQDERDAWTRKLDFEVPVLEEGQEVEYLYFVGCLSSFDDRNQRIARAVVSLLEQAGVNYAILGKGESCTGDPARRLGNEYLYQIMAERTIETLNSHSFKTVITSCPHCFNALGNEYEQFGGGYKTIHHTELLEELVAEGRLQPRTALNESVTYHDPCYLGRYNGVFDAPRNVLAAIPGVEIIEMPRSREKALCCGGGGGGIFMEVPGEQRINDIRLEEAQNTGAGKLAAGCPFCVVMFDSAAATGSNDGPNVLIPEDISEMLLRSVQGDEGA